MTRIRSAVLLLLAPLLLLSACGDDTGVASGAAATVNEREIGEAGFRDRLRMFAENPEFGYGLTGVQVHADGSTATDRVDASFAAAALELEILLDLVDAEVQDRGIEVTEADLEAVRAGFGAELLGYLEELPDDYVSGFERWNAQLRLLQEAMVAEVEVPEITDDDVAAYFEENAERFESQVCSSHVLVETEAEAEEVLAELDGGADFATVASERSTDPSAASNGGDLGCTAATDFVEPFAEAITEGAVGELLGPVETDYGFHVIIVHSRGAALEDVADDIRTQLEAEASAEASGAFGAWLEEAVLGADITIGSRYGTWNAENGQIVPPESPSDGNATLSIG